MYDYELLYLEVSAIDEVHQDLFELEEEEAVLLVVDHRQLLLFRWVSISSELNSVSTVDTDRHDAKFQTKNIFKAFVLVDLNSHL